MPLPKHSLFLFRKSPLKLVVGQVRFPALPGFSDGSSIPPFSKAVRGDYPRSDKENQISFQLSGKGVEQSAGETLWRFSTRDNSWAVVLGETAITLEARKYSSFDEFLSRFEGVLTAAKEVLEVTEQTRIGLRYVNEIRYPGAETMADWSQLLRPEFLGFAASDILDGPVERTFQEVLWLRDDGVLAIRHGLLTGTAVPPRMGEIPASGRFYLLDLDYYRQEDRELDPTEILTKMRRYNSVMYQFFSWTLARKLEEYMEPEPCEPK